MGQGSSIFVQGEDYLSLDKFIMQLIFFLLDIISFGSIFVVN